MTQNELLKEVLKDPQLRSKYGIPKEELENASFDSVSEFKIIEVIKAIIRIKGQSIPDNNVYRSVKTLFSIE
jgi:hypothetical protein